MCSVGSTREYIEGSVNKTKMDLLDTLGIIANSKVFVGNDSGLYHCANALEVPSVVIFTATSVIKNYDDRFHKYSSIVARDDLACRVDCQLNKAWIKECSVWKCRDIDPDVVYDAILNKFNRIDGEKVVELEESCDFVDTQIITESIYHNEDIELLDDVGFLRRLLNKVFCYIKKSYYGIIVRRNKLLRKTYMRGIII